MELKRTKLTLTCRTNSRLNHCAEGEVALGNRSLISANVSVPWQSAPSASFHSRQFSASRFQNEPPTSAEAG